LSASLCNLNFFRHRADLMQSEQRMACKTT
jgi:hypothetical protein